MCSGAPFCRLITYILRNVSKCWGILLQLPDFHIGQQAFFKIAVMSLFFYFSISWWFQTYTLDIQSNKNSNPGEDIKALLTLFSCHWFTMCSFYERESPEWPVKEDVVLRRHWMKFAKRYELSVTLGDRKAQSARLRLVRAQDTLPANSRS